VALKALERKARLEPARPEWQRRLPVLRDATAALRQLREADARSLTAHINHDSMGRFIATPPSTTEEFKRFIRWTHRQRRAGLHVCFGVVPTGMRDAIGVIQVWSFETSFATAEWGFALSKSVWGTGLFPAAAGMVLDFAFTVLGVKRLEARSVDGNGRGNTVLCKLGAVPEGRLRNDFRSGATVRDHIIWSILSEDWLESRRGAIRVHSGSMSE